jgi:hypothetical protein
MPRFVGRSGSAEIERPVSRGFEANLFSMLASHSSSQILLAQQSGDFC